MNNVVSTVQGLFGVAAIIVGLCSRQSATALKWGAIIGLICAMLFVALAVSAEASNLDLMRFAGYLVGMVLVIALFGLIGHGIRRGFGYLGRLFRRQPAPRAPDRT